MSNRQGKPAVNKGTLKTAKRLLKYVTGTYKVQFLYPHQFDRIDLGVAVTPVSAG